MSVANVGNCLSKNLTFFFFYHYQVHSEGPLQCSKCKKCFRNSSQLVKHRKVHTSPRPFKCKQCGEPCRHRGSLFSHYQVHTPYERDDCGKSSRPKSSLFNHCQVCTGEKPWVQWTWEVFHLKQKARARPKPFKCNARGRVFAMNYSLLEHERVHTAARHHECKKRGRFIATTLAFLSFARVTPGKWHRCATDVHSPLVINPKYTRK